MFNKVTHALGYILGDTMYYAMIHEHWSKSEVRRLYCDPFSEEGATRDAYFYLVYSLADVEIPERAQ